MTKPDIPCPAYWAITHRGAQLIESDTKLGDKFFDAWEGVAPQADTDSSYSHTIQLGSILVADEVGFAFYAEEIGLRAKEVSNYKVPVALRPYYGAKEVVSSLIRAISAK